MKKQSPPYRHRIGADENGLGPRLGPMLTTAVLAEVDDRGHATVERKVRGKLRERLGDSKALVSHGDVALAEAWARVLVERTVGARVGTVSELISATRSAAGEVVAGDPKRIKEVTDIWTFARDITAANPNWRLVATQAAS